MKLRIKYTKTGVLRFIGHLDMMRLFQKAIRRAKLDVAYSKGFSPHQIISFAAPMPLGMTSEGEYFDGEFESVPPKQEMIERLNQTLPDGVRVLDVVKLPETAKPSMALVSASDYLIYTNEEGNPDCLKSLESHLEAFKELSNVEIMKKTKTKEEPVNIRPSIYQLALREDGIYMLLASGSKDNLKPELVVEAMCQTAGIAYNRYDYRIHRLETYMGGPDHLQSLLETGESW